MSFCDKLWCYILRPCILFSHIQKKSTPKTNKFFLKHSDFLIGNDCGHQIKLFAPRRFTKLTIMKFVCWFPRFFFLSSILINQASFYVFEEKQFCKVWYRKYFWKGADKINSHYKDGHHLEWSENSVSYLKLEYFLLCSGFTWDDIPDSISIVCNNGSLLTKVRYKNRCQPRRSTKQQLTGKWKHSSSTKNKKNVLIDRVISEGNLSRKYVV